MGPTHDRRGLACVWGHVLDTIMNERLFKRRSARTQDDWTTDAALYVGMQVILSLGDYMNVQCHACIGGKSIGEDIRRLDYGVQVCSWIMIHAMSIIL